MRKLNLRLTDEQHAELAQAAEKAGTSIQAEVIGRVFPGASVAADGRTVPRTREAKPYSKADQVGAPRERETGRRRR